MLRVSNDANFLRKTVPKNPFKKTILQWKKVRSKRAMAA